MNKISFKNEGEQDIKKAKNKILYLRNICISCVTVQLLFFALSKDYLFIFSQDYYNHMLASIALFCILLYIIIIIYLFFITINCKLNIEDKYIKTITNTIYFISPGLIFFGTYFKSNFIIYGLLLPIFYILFVTFPLSIAMDSERKVIFQWKEIIKFAGISLLCLFIGGSFFLAGFQSLDNMTNLAQQTYGHGRAPKSVGGMVFGGGLITLGGFIIGLIGLIIFILCLYIGYVELIAYIYSRKIKKIF